VNNLSPKKSLLIIKCMLRLGILFLFILSINSLKSQVILRKEFIGRNSANSVTVQMIFGDSVEARVEYGTLSGSYQFQSPWQIFPDNVSAEFVVTGLQLNTKYFYRINYRIPGTPGYSVRQEYSFRTQRPVGDEFTFDVQADPHMDNQSDTAVYGICLQNQFDDNPDFMIDLGDFIMTDKLKNSSGIIPHDTIKYRCNVLRDFYEKISHSIPIYIALGNHEGEAGWNLNGTSENIAVWNTIERQKYFLNPIPNAFYSGDTIHHPYVGQRENYYSWTWGDAQFVVLDPYWYTSPKPDSLHGWNWTLGKTQYDWLKNTLENSNSKFKFVFAHQIIGGDPEGRGGVEFADLYEWGGHNLDGSFGFASNRPGWYKPIKDLLTENRVTIFFHGHDHFFGKQEKDCLIYQETPQPSHPNFQSSSYAQDYGYTSGHILPNSGHLRVHVSQSGVTVDYIRAYKPENENPTRHNKDVSATYFISDVNCYDSLFTGVPILWNSDYSDELIYPNPFAEETNIEFNLKQAERLNISIYSLNGLEVRKLISGSLVPEGKFKLIWDGKNGYGNELPNGYYIYKILGENSSLKSGKILLKR